MLSENLEYREIELAMLAAELAVIETREGRHEQAAVLLAEACQRLLLIVQKRIPKPPLPEHRALNSGALKGWR